MQRFSPWQGLALAAIGVLGFSGTLPATRIAVADLGAVVVGLGRALVAALLALVYLLVRGEPVPARRHWPSFAVIALTVVAGFPLLSAIVLTSSSASHAAVVVALAPACTAILAVLRAGERPARSFWLGVALGLFGVCLYVFGASPDEPVGTDLGLLAAVLCVAIGYTEGARLSRELSGFCVISWSLVLSAPFVALVLAVSELPPIAQVRPAAWLGFAYVSLVSMFAAFAAWYAGLAAAGISRGSQLQLFQPFLSVLWASLFLDEPVTPGLLGALCICAAGVALAVRARLEHVAVRAR
ncbi:MAG: DMT family transporter [Pseudomonadota bacterium]